MTFNCIGPSKRRQPLPRQCYQYERGRCHNTSVGNCQNTKGRIRLAWAHWRNHEVVYRGETGHGGSIFWRGDIGYGRCCCLILWVLKHLSMEISIVSHQGICQFCCLFTVGCMFVADQYMFNCYVNKLHFNFVCGPGNLSGITYPPLFPIHRITYTKATVCNVQLFVSAGHYQSQRRTRQSKHH